MGWKLAMPAQRRAEFPSWSWTGWYGSIEPRSAYEGYVRNTHNLEIMFTYREVGGFLMPAVDLKTILGLYQTRSLSPSYIPSITVTGTILRVRVGREHDSLFEHSEPPGLAAFLDSDNGFLVANEFFLTYNDPGLATDVFEVECIGLILGTAQGTYFAGKGRGTRALNSTQFLLIILALWERDGKWERLGLIEHDIPVRTNECPILADSEYLSLRTERRCLQLA